MRVGSLGILVVVLALSACSTSYETTHEPPGSLPPPPTAKPAPVKPSGTVGAEHGIMAGAQIGGLIDRNLSPADRTKMKNATQRALENGAPGTATKWRNAQTGAYGSVTPQPRFSMNGASCREFQQHINAGGEMATGYGTACRDRRGIWRIAENG